MRFTPEFKKTRQVMRAPSPNHPIHRRNHTGPRDPRHDGLTDDLRILLANWFFKAVQKALQGDAKRKYFEHAGALLTADGTEDELIKLEGTPRGYRIQI